MYTSLGIEEDEGQDVRFNREKERDHVEKTFEQYKEKFFTELEQCHQE